MKKPMPGPRIAVIFDNFGPYHIARLTSAARYCNLLGVEVASFSAEYAWQPTTVVEFERKTLFQLDQGDEKSPLALERRLEEAISDYRAELIAVPGWSGYHALIAVRVSLRRSIPVLLMSESQETDLARTWLKEWIKSRYLKLCRAALVGGKPQRAYLEKLGMPGCRIFHGYDAVDNAYFAAGAAEARGRDGILRQQYKLPTRYFLASARFIEKKNLQRLIEAYAVYRQASTRKMDPYESIWHLVLLGDGEMRPHLESLVIEHGLQDFVHLPGFKQYPVLPIYYGLASAFIHASISEQWGLVVNEAMASGLPVLVSARCGCAPDLVRDGINGFTFDPLDVDRMSSLMLKMGKSECDLTVMGQASREIISRWGPQTFAEGLIKAASAALAAAPPTKWSYMDKVLLWMLIRWYV